MKLALMLALGLSAVPAAQDRAGGGYEDLAALFEEWREFQKPRVVDDVPDYTAAADGRAAGRVPEFQPRLQAIDPNGWPIPQQVDWHLVRAEMNGLDFDHRVLRPWSRNPCFYYGRPRVGVGHAAARGGLACPARSSSGATRSRSQRRTLAELEGQASRDPADPRAGARQPGRGRARPLEARRARQTGARARPSPSSRSASRPHHPDLVADVDAARKAVDEFARVARRRSRQG